MARGKSPKLPESSPLLDLQQRFAALPPIALLGSTLLERKTQGLAISEQELVDASLEVIAYSKRCQQTAAHMNGLPAIPADLECLEFGL